MGTNVMNLREKRTRRAGQRFDRHRTGGIGSSDEAVSVVDRQAGHRQHALRPV